MLKFKLISIKILIYQLFHLSLCIQIKTYKDMKTIFEEFIDSLESLKDGEVLTTSFGAMNKFEAGKVTDVEKELCGTVLRYYIKKVKGAMYTFRTKDSDILTFSTPENLSFKLTVIERFQYWYAKNEFTSNLQFFDNYKAFLNAFKLRTL